MKNLGIVQGRLSRPINNKIQEFPIHSWQEEFDLLEPLGLSHIEWIVNKNYFKNNPLFYNDLNGYPISSICCDHLIDERITNKEFLEQNLVPVCDAAVKNGIKRITIPLLEEASLGNSISQKVKQFVESFKSIYEIFTKQENLMFSFELNDFYILDSLNIKFENITCTYDTGNLNCHNPHDQGYILMYWPEGLIEIDNIHLKDTDHEDKRSYPPGKGTVPFKRIFTSLKSKNYNNLFTLQTARGEPGKEIETIKKHKQHFERIYHEKHF